MSNPYSDPDAGKKQQFYDAHLAALRAREIFGGRASAPGSPVAIRYGLGQDLDSIPVASAENVTACIADFERQMGETS